MDIYEEKDEGKEATPCCPLDFEIAFQFSVEPTFAKLNHKQDLRIHLKQAFLVLVISTLLLQLSLTYEFANMFCKSFKICNSSLPDKV